MGLLNAGSIIEKYFTIPYMCQIKCYVQVNGNESRYIKQWNCFFYLLEISQELGNCLLMGPLNAVPQRIWTFESHNKEGSSECFIELTLWLHNM